MYRSASLSIATVAHTHGDAMLTKSSPWLASVLVWHVKVLWIVVSTHMTDGRAVWLVGSPRPSASPQSGKAEEHGCGLVSAKPGASHASEPPSLLLACEGWLPTTHAASSHVWPTVVCRLTTRMRISCRVSPSSFSLAMNRYYFTPRISRCSFWQLSPQRRHSPVGLCSCHSHDNQRATLPSLDSTTPLSSHTDFSLLSPTRPNSNANFSGCGVCVFLSPCRALLAFHRLTSSSQASNSAHDKRPSRHGPRVFSS